MCIAYHRVRHLTASDAEPLFCAEADSAGFHIMVVIRSDVFRGDFARRSKQKPRPADVFDTAKRVVAQKLAREPWRLPSLAECIAVM